MRWAVGLAAALVLTPVGDSRAQSTVNPDISFIGDLRGLIHNDQQRSDDRHELLLADPALELVASGYVNPYALAHVTIGWHGEAAAEIEEAYITFLRGLPLDLQVRVGKHLLEFGRLNTVHEHAFSFVSRPLPHTEYFGDEGLNDIAVRSSLLLPTGDAYTEFMLGITQGDLLAGHGHSHEEEDAESPELGYHGRLTSSFGLSEKSEFAVGISGVTAIHDAEEDLRAWVGGVDFKYRWKDGRNRSLTLEAEGLLQHRELEDGGTVTSRGTYGYIDYQFRQRYNAGLIGEYAQGRMDANTHTTRVGIFAGFSPAEDTSRLRVTMHWTEDESGESYLSWVGQLVFSLGPHAPHSF